MNEILKILIKRNRQRKLLTNDDVKRICHIILRYSISSNDKRIEFYPIDILDEDCAGMCLEKSIVFFNYGIEQLIDKCYQSLINNYSMDGAKIDIYNYFYLCIIFHELAHVRQHYIVENYRQKLEGKLFSICHDLAQDDEFYGNYYYDFLTEINANNMASTRVCNLYSKLPKEYLSQNDILVYQAIMLKCMLHDNYDILENEEVVSSPAERLAAYIEEDTNIDSSKYNELLNKQYNFTIYRKLMLGLPLTHEEYCYVDDIYNNLNDGNGVNALKKIQKKL